MIQGSQTYTCCATWIYRSKRGTLAASTLARAASRAWLSPARMAAPLARRALISSETKRFLSSSGRSGLLHRHSLFRTTKYLPSGVFGYRTMACGALQPYLADRFCHISRRRYKLLVWSGLRLRMYIRNGQMMLALYPSISLPLIHLVILCNLHQSMDGCMDLMIAKILVIASC